MIQHIISVNNMKHTPTTVDIQQLCKKLGVSLTAKREQILSILLAEPLPLSAYDIAEIYKKTYQQTMPVMSIYRILDFLNTVGIVHKLDTVNQYTVCAHLQCTHEHKNAQFLICGRCHSVEEVTIDEQTHQLLMQGINKAGFKLNNLNFELHGLCQTCAGHH